MATLERVWIAYLLAVIAIAVVVPGTGPGYRPGLFLLLHCGLLVLQLWIASRSARMSEGRLRMVRCMAILVTLPLVFSTLGFVLPAVNPEPWEWNWLGFDRAVFGFDPTVAMQSWLSPWFAELLQLCYTSFYLLPIVASLLILRARGTAAFDRTVTITLSAFLFSYLGYFLFPTLPPYRFLDHGGELEFWWCGSALHHFLDLAEHHRWDCFPSGHTMMALVTLFLVHRWARAWFWPFAVVVTLLVLSTMALRYHWVIDVVAGALLAWPALRLGDLLLDRDGATAAGQRAARVTSA